MEIIINNQSFNETMKLATNQIFEQFVVQLQELNLNSLEYVIIPNDFGEELIDFQRSYNLREGYTNNEFGRAHGKVLSYVEDGDLKCTMFLDPIQIESILYNSARKQHSIHLIHHEFCHIHDNFIKYNIFGVEDLEDIFIGTPDKVSQVSYAHADLIWSEYIATRLSTKSKPKEHDYYIGDLLNLADKTYNECKEHLKKHYFETEEFKTFGQIQLTCSLFFKIAAYFIGYCHGMNIDPPKEINEIMSKYSYLNGVWESLSPALHDMYKTYGNWNEVSIFNELALVVRRLWENIGINLENSKYGLKIHINEDL